MLKRLFGDGLKRLYNSTLGCELTVVSQNNEVVVSRVVRGTPAHFSGKLAEGDLVVAINGEATNAAEQLWQAWWMDEEIGSPVWLKICPHDSKAGTSVAVCLVRCAEQPLGKPKPSEGCVGVGLDGRAPSVAYLEEGGAAWLALLAPAQIPAPILQLDHITMIDGQSVESAQRAMTLLSGRAFSRVHLTVIRKGAAQRVTVVRSPRLEGSEMDAAVEYRMQLARTPALPPSLRHCRRNIPEVEPPLIGSTSCIRQAAAHCLMVGSPKMILLGADGTHISEEARWVAVALVCSLLAPALDDPAPNDIDAAAEEWTEKGLVNSLCAGKHVPCEP